MTTAHLLSSTTPCIHGSKDYKRCPACQRVLASQQAQVHRRKRRATTKPSPPGLFDSPARVSQPARPETIAAARAAAEQAVVAARQAADRRRAERRTMTSEQDRRRRAVIRDAMLKLHQAGVRR